MSYFDGFVQSLNPMAAIRSTPSGVKVTAQVVRPGGVVIAASATGTETSQLMSGLFGSLKKELNSAATSISREVDSVSKKAGDKWDEIAKSPLLDNFRTSNVVELISRSSGRSLEIVTSNAGHLVVDGCGPEGNNHMHTKWTVLNEGRNIVRLCNNNNFLAIVQGNVMLRHYPDPSLAGPETRFRLHEIQKFVCLESDVEAHRYVGVLKTGQLKPALACGKDFDGQWGVRLIYSPYQNYPQQPPRATGGTTQVVHTGGATYVQPGAPGTVTVTTTTTRKQ